MRAYATIVAPVCRFMPRLASLVRPAHLVLLVVSAGCSTAGGAGDPPILEMFTPARGTTADQFMIDVTGRVTDDEPAPRAVVNGVEATVAADGTFAVTVPVASGITLIETHAIDARGNDVRDVRAVLAGDLQPTDGTIAAPIGARIGADGLADLGRALAVHASSLDWNALALAMNPVYDSSGCNSARIDIEQLTVGTIGVAIVPRDGALGLEVSIADVYVRMHVDFEALCIDGSTTVEVRSSKARITGDLAIAANAGRLEATLPASAVALENFALNIGGVPGAIEDLIEGEAREAAEDALVDVVRDEVPPAANDALGGLLAEPLATDILERPTTFTMVPAAVVIDAGGLLASVDTKVLVTGGEGGVYAASPQPLESGVFQGSDLGIAVADDTLNQLLSGLWASGALTPALPLDGDGAILAPLLDDDARSISLDMMLPPTVRAAGGVLELAIGDLILSVRDASDVEIQSFALSIVSSLSAVPTATGVAMTIGEPVVKAQVLAQTEVVDQPMTDDQLEGLVSGAWPLLGGILGGSLQNLPLPEVSGLVIGAPSLGGHAGFVVIEVPLE
jgi:hypothetical protein